MTAATYDERRGVPSASAMDRVANCPPSHTMAAMLPAESEENEDAASGTRIHAVLAGLADESTLNAAEAETCEMCERQTKELAQEWGGLDFGGEIIRERRLGLTALGRVIELTPKSQAMIRFSGQADLILITGSRALVIDYKTGRGDYAEAVDNAQLASLAVLVSLWRPLKSVRVAIVQPWEGKPTVADYDEVALRQATEWLFGKLNAAEVSTPKDAKAGPWCKWCRVGKAGRCEAVNDAALAVVETLQPANIAGLPDDKQREAMFARAMELPASRLAATMRGLGMVKRFVAAIEGAARERAREDAEFQRFYELKQKQGRRSISDVRVVFERCAKHGVTAEAFTAACSVGLGDVKDLLRAATGLKGKTLDELHDEALHGATETGKPSFELIQVEGSEA